MRRRHPLLPRLWLMTDERMGDALWPALERLPRGSGVIFRHYGLPGAERRRLFGRVAQVARRRRLVLVRAGAAPLGRGENGTHGTRGRGIVTWAVHDRRQAIEALRNGANLLFVSPVFPTRSHPGARALGPVRFGLLTRGLPTPVVALGGMDARGARRLDGFRIHGWAAIDAWSR